MTEIPEHLRRRSEEARARAAAAQGGDAAPAEEPAAAPAEPAAADPAAEAAASKIPAHLLARSQAARAKSSGAAEAPTAPATTAPPAAGAGTAVATAPPPASAAGPGGHTQRLLTVVRAGSIQDVRAAPVDKVHTWPHLLVGEFVASLACTAVLLVFSAFVNAPLLQQANPNLTPNPAKAPWYFMGLQELLTMFHPMVAGVTIPGMALFLLILTPYLDRNPSNKPEDRKFLIVMMTLFLMFWAVLVIVGSMFRGPGFNFIFPWRDGIFFEF